MKYKLLLADRSECNESESKDVYGAIVQVGSDVVICYVPSERQAIFILDILKNIT